MTLHELRDAPPAELAAALAEFEARFTYPLGPSRSFRIDHGEDYPRFYRAIGAGNARSWVLRRGNLRGVLGIAIRPLQMPDGTLREAAYIGDVKAASGRALVQLASAADAWARPQVTAAYGIVMDGTAALPTSYTGRVGIEPFIRLAQVLVLRLPTAGIPAQPCATLDAAQGDALFGALSRGRIAPTGGDPSVRSETPPTWLASADGSACGRLEDTRRAKRLIACDSGKEMLSAHLACFAFGTYQAGAGLIRAALALAADRGFPAMFVAIAPHDFAGLEPLLDGIDIVVAPATIYGAGLADVAAAWNVSTSEI